MIDLIPELIEHVLSYLTLEECTTLVRIKTWGEIVTNKVLAQVDKTLATYGNTCEQLYIGSHQTKKICRRYDYEDEDSPYNTWNITNTNITETYKLEITKHEKKMCPEEFETFIGLLDTYPDEGYVFPYTVCSPCMIMPVLDRSELESEYGEIRSDYYTENVIDWNLPVDDVEKYENEKKEDFLRILELMGLIVEKVYSMEEGTRYKESFSYQIFMLMPDGTSFTLALSTECKEDRYTLYNE